MWSPERIASALAEVDEALHADELEEAVALLEAIEPQAAAFDRDQRVAFLICQARCLAQMGEMEPACEAYSAAYEEKKDPDLGFAAAYCAIDASRLPLARQLLDTILASEPYDKRALMERSFLDLKQGLFRSARQRLPEPQEFEDFIFQSRLWLDAGETVQARDALERASALATEPEQRALCARQERRFDLPLARCPRDETYLQCGCLLLDQHEGERLEGLEQAHLLAIFARLCKTGFIRPSGFAALDRKARPFVAALCAALDVPEAAPGETGVWSLMAIYDAEKPAPARCFVLAASQLGDAPPAIVGRMAPQGAELEPLPGDRTHQTELLLSLVSSVELDRELEDWLNARRGLLFERGPGREQRALSPLKEGEIDFENISLRDLGALISHDPEGMRSAVLEGGAWAWLPLLRHVDSPFLSWAHKLETPRDSHVEEAVAANPAARSVLYCVALQGRSMSLPGTHPFGHAEPPAEAQQLWRLVCRAAEDEDPDARLLAAVALCRGSSGSLAGADAALVFDEVLGALCQDPVPEVASWALAVACRLPGGHDQVRSALEEAPQRLGVALGGRLLLSAEPADRALYLETLARLVELPMLPQGIASLSCLAAAEDRLAVLQEIPEELRAAALSMNIRALGSEAAALFEERASELLLAPHTYLLDWLQRCKLLTEEWAQAFLEACLTDDSLRYAAAALLVSAGRSEFAEVIELGWRRLQGLQQDFPLVARFFPPQAAAPWSQAPGPQLCDALNPQLELSGPEDACPEVFDALRARFREQAADPENLWARTAAMLRSAPHLDELGEALKAELRRAAWQGDVPVPFLPWPAEMDRSALALLRLDAPGAQAFLREAPATATPWQRVQIARAIELEAPSLALQLAGQWVQSNDAELRAWAQRLDTQGPLLA